MPALPRVVSVSVTLALVGAAIAACAKATAPSASGPASVDIAQTDAAAALTIESSGAPTRPASKPAFEAPPTGEYEITTSLVSDTCTPTIASPPPVTLVVFIKQSQGRTVGNFALPQAGPSFGPAGVRSDVRLEPSEPSSYMSRPFGSLCPSYTIMATVRPMEVTRDRIRISSVREYGDPSACARPNEPSRCRREYLYTYTLTAKLCDPHCAASSLPHGPDGGRDVKCNCP